MSTLGAIARYEMIYSVRNRWIDGLLATFALAAAAVSVSGALAGGYAAGFSRTTISLLQVTLYLFPLVALLLGAWGCPWLRESRGMLGAQPVARGSLLLGTFAGQFAALAVGTGIGFGLGGAAIGYLAGISGLGRYALFVLVALLVLAAFLSIALLIAAIAGSRGRALAIGLVVWFVAIVGYDLFVFAVAGSLSGISVQTALISMLFGNPVDLGRMVGLMVIKGPGAFGTAGTLLVRTFGEGAGLAAMVSALLLWIAAPLAAAAVILRRRDLG